MKAVIFAAFAVAVSLFVCGVQLGMRYCERAHVADAAPPIPAPPLDCPASVAVDLVSGEHAIRITTSPLGHVVVNEPGSGRKFLMLPVRASVAREAQ